MFFILISSIITRTSLAGEVVGCTWDKHCFDPTPYCDTVNSVCVECLVNEACSDPTPHCDPKSKSCVGCLQHSDCSPPNRICNPATLVCEPECASDADCKPNEFCNLERDSRVCLCKTDLQRCNGTNQSCDKNGICSCDPGFVNDTTGQCVAAQHAQKVKCAPEMDSVYAVPQPLTSRASVCGARQNVSRMRTVLKKAGSAHQNITASAQLGLTSSKGSVWRPVIWVADAKWGCAMDGGLFVTSEQTLVSVGTDGLHQKPFASEGQLSGSDHTPDHIIQINTDTYKLPGTRIKTATHYAKCHFEYILQFSWRPDNGHMNKP